MLGIFRWLFQYKSFVKTLRPRRLLAKKSKFASGCEYFKLKTFLSVTVADFHSSNSFLIDLGFMISVSFYQAIILVSFYSTFMTVT